METDTRLSSASPQSHSFCRYMESQQSHEGRARDEHQDYHANCHSAAADHNFCDENRPRDTTVE